MNAICIFCGSNRGAQPIYEAAARETGRVLAQQGLTVVFGGSRVGLMGIVADSALEHGGRVVGVLPGALRDKELAHHGLTELHIVNSMHERKAKMADLSDAFIALPGGFGTYDEFCEVLTWGQLRFHSKPCALLNVGGFYDGLLAFFDHATREGFVHAKHRAGVLVSDNVTDLLAQCAAFQPAMVNKWADLER